MSWSPVERILARSAAPRVVFCCEHASNALPPGMAWPTEDAPLAAQHWAFDLGAADVTRRVAAALGAPAVLSAFSRLVVDPNRPLDSETLFRSQADGRAIQLNVGLTEAARAARIAACYQPYHAALDEVMAQHPGCDLVSVHSFTDCYEGSRRDVQIGVLFDVHEALAERWMRALDGCGYDVRRNEPWSGREGLMYSPQEHALAAGVGAVELELRQDLTTDPVQRDRLVALIVSAVEACHEARAPGAQT